MKPNHLPREVARQLGPYYVYALVDPRDDMIFYVGKGTGSRLLAHGKAADLTSPGTGQTAKQRLIREIRSKGFEPRVDVIRHGLSEAEALLVEASLIDSLANLTNLVSGHGSGVGRKPLDEYTQRYGARLVSPNAPPVLLVRLGEWTDRDMAMQPGYKRRGHGFRIGITDRELLDSTRGWWRVSPASVERKGIHHAVAVHEGITRAVMTIGKWHQRTDGRRAFHAELITSGALHRAWVGEHGKRVDIESKSQSPIIYWPFTT